MALQGGDPATLRLWRLLVAQSERYFLTVYDLLDVTLTETDFRGESSYNDLLAPRWSSDLDRLGPAAARATGRPASSRPASRAATASRCR